MATPMRIDSLHDIEVILLALDWYCKTRQGTAGAKDCADMASKIRQELMASTQKNKGKPPSS